jgi:hypothetical protein
MSLLAAQLERQFARGDVPPHDPVHPLHPHIPSVVSTPVTRTGCSAFAAIPGDLAAKAGGDGKAARCISTDTRFTTS